MAAKKTAKKVTPEKTAESKECFAGYPFAEAYEIVYPQKEDAAGKKQFRMKRGNSNEFSLDENGKKIPLPDIDNPIVDPKTGEPKKKKASTNAQLPWGFAIVDTGESRSWTENGKPVVYKACHRLRSGATEEKTVWIRADQLQPNRCLEVVFVDIGQGDGCFMVTPENKKMVIDAGQFGNMRHYLHWRYGSDAKKESTTFEAAVISHPDADHYKGFEQLFERDNFFFKTVYTNGLMEYAETDAARKKWNKPPKSSFTGLGPVQTIKGKKLVSELITTKEELKTFLESNNGQNWKTGEVARKGTTTKKKSGKHFPTMLNEAMEGWKLKTEGGQEIEFMDEKEGTMGDFRMLSVLDEYMPGYGYARVPDKTTPDKTTPDKSRPEKTFPVFDKTGGETGRREFSIQVLGPVVEQHNGRPMLEYLESNISKTKNGHSIVLRLQYGGVSLMLGGDLNIPSEHLLMSHHTGMKSPPDLEHESAFIDAARKVFQVDIAKSCHHGSSDFTHFFLRALNPVATVVSSGDKECHSHPRSDTLGAIGNCSRANPRPLIFSTELARSAEDNNQKPHLLVQSIADKVDDMLKKIVKVTVKKTPGESATDHLKRLQEAQEVVKADLLGDLKKKLVGDIPRSVAVYGAITVVTDGEKVIIYQKLEKKGSHGEYDIYRLEPSGRNGTGPLMYQSKH